MKSTFKTDDGRSITVQPLPHSKAVLVQSHDPHAGAMMHLLIPADMAGVFAQAIELAAAWKPSAAECGLRCHDGNACAAGQRPCPTPAACGAVI